MIDYAFKATGVGSIEPLPLPLAVEVELEISLMAEATDAKEIVDGLEVGAGAGAASFSFFSSTGVDSTGAAFSEGAEVVFSEDLFIVMITASESDSSSIVTSFSSARAQKGMKKGHTSSEESLTTSGFGGAGADKT